MTNTTTNGTTDSTLEHFFRALRERKVEDVRASLDADPALVHAFDPNPWCCRGTPLGVAVGTGQRDLVELLLDRGADPNRKSAWWAGGFSPLTAVKPHDRTWLIPLLVEHGARIDAYVAAQHGLRDELARILEHDPFTVNQVAGDGQRPLHVAATVEIADLLLDRGADLEARCVDHGATPTQYAVAPRPTVARYLIEQGASTDAFMLSALGDVDRFERLLARDPEARDRTYDAVEFPAPGSKAAHIYVYTLCDYGCAPLHFAAGNNQPSMVTWLLERGADPHVRGGYDEQTPAHIAAWRDHAEAIEALAAGGADLDLVSGPEHTTPPIMWALVGGSAKAFRALLEAGVRPEAYLLEKARQGEEGAFQPHSRGDADTYRQMQEILKEFGAQTG